MEISLKENVDANLVYALGNEELKRKLLIGIFNIKDQNKTKLHILIEFLKYPDIEKQLLDENSFYYQLLINPLTYESSNNQTMYLTNEEYSEIDIKEGYASIKHVVESNIDDFFEFQFDKMIHHFDKYVQNYLYFYYENEVKRVPVLYYIQTMQRKIELWQKFCTFPCSLDMSEEVEKEYYTYFNDFVNKEFVEMAMESLEENIGKCLSASEEAYWNYLLDEANAISKQVSENILLELKK